MNTRKKIAACALVAAMTAGITACDDAEGISSGAAAPALPTQSTQASTTTDPDENAPTDQEIKTLDTSGYTPDGNAGTVKYLGYYDITKDQKGTEQSLIFQSEQYGGKIEYISTPSGVEFYDRLGTMIASDDSPDLCPHDAMLYPGNVGKNLFEPLDDYIDIDSPLWAGMKDVVESFAYKGKHYKYPHKITTSFALNYSKKTIEEYDLTDPYDLYTAGEWTWEAMRDLMIQFCGADDSNIGLYGTDTTISALITTTGTKLVDVKPSGEMINNIANSNVTRTMNFYETLCRDGVMYAQQYGSWIGPQDYAKVSDKLLFYAMEPEWTYTAATQDVQNKPGVEDDIFDTVSDFSFVPFPRDKMADAYYQAFDVFGFVVPKGAKNIKGAIDMINCFRVYETDENVIAQTRKDHVDPEKIYFTEGKYTGTEKWQIKWGEREYDLWREMCDPEKFTLLTENAFGFGQEFWNNYVDAINGAAFNGESWSQMSAEISPVIDAALNEYK